VEPQEPRIGDPLSAAEARSLRQIRTLGCPLGVQIRTWLTVWWLDRLPRDTKSTRWIGRVHRAAARTEQAWWAGKVVTRDRFFPAAILVQGEHEGYAHLPGRGTRSQATEGRRPVVLRTPRERLHHWLRCVGIRSTVHRRFDSLFPCPPQSLESERSLWGSMGIVPDHLVSPHHRGLTYLEVLERSKHGRLVRLPWQASPEGSDAAAHGRLPVDGYCLGRGSNVPGKHK
jgi:hypothetical protein